MTRPKTRESKSELSRRLKLHRGLLDGLLAKPGAPAPDRRKRYLIREVVAFVAANREGNHLDNLRGARLREVQLRCIKLERELSTAAGDVVSLAEINSIFGHLAVTLKTKLFAGLETDLPPKLDGQPAVAMRPILREFGDSLCDVMAEAADRFNKAGVKV